MAIINAFKSRYLERYILSDLLDEKMVFVGGPRQVGKTTLATELLTKNIYPFAYLNWDNREDRKNISASLWPADAKLLIIDELHKYRSKKRSFSTELNISVYSIFAL